MRICAELLIVFIVFFGGREISRWQRADLAELLSPVQKVRRIIGLVLLLILSLMLFTGTFMPDPRFSPLMIQRLELIYWLFFTLLTVFIPLIAFLEFKDSIKRGSQLRREIYKSIVTTPLDQLPTENDANEKPKT